jgi:predicted TIM-barrel fold metal-dependent hydrolase
MNQPQSDYRFRTRLFSHAHLLLLIACAIALAVPRFYAQQNVATPAPPAKRDVYLLLGDSSMAGGAAIPDDAAEVLDRCFLLDDKNEWEPARNPLNRYSTIADKATVQALGPGYEFARTLLERDKNLTLGLIVNAGNDAKIEGWLGKSELYRGARKRARAGIKEDSEIKGVLWQQGQGDLAAPDGYLEKLQTLVSNLRTDFNHPHLPVVVAPLPHGDAINSQIAKLPTTTHGTAIVSSEGLTVEGTHFDTKSQFLLGKRCAEEMIRLRATLPAAAQAPTDIKFIDPHVHAMSVTPLGLRAVAKWMEERNVERCIVSPLSHKGSRPQSEEERAIMLENFRPYKGRIDRMALIDPGEVETVELAVTMLQREIADGAVGFGEHYGVGLMFDDPKNLLLYEACEKVGLPVMFHIDQNKNMVEPGMARVDRVLKMFPRCKVVAHAYWWRQLQNGACDRQLQEHPNLYADMSGVVVMSVLNRDRKYAREFLIRNQDKLLWATDEGWWSFADKDRQMNQHYTLLEELDLPDEVRQKIYRGNAEKVYGLKKPGN